ncbi:MAG: aminopeptidase P family protein [Clostridia bacterium]|nr:aminopeptidase P family protein [Clostridia bacterium]
MAEQGVDCLLVSPSPDLIYLTGLDLWADERLFAAVFSPGHAPFFVSNQLHALTLEGMGCDDAVFWNDGEDAFRLLAAELDKRGILSAHLAVDNLLPAGLLVPLLRHFPDSQISLSAQLTAPLRMYKDVDEVQALRTACIKASEALRITMRRGREWIGHTEAELASALCSEMVRQGLAYGSASVSAGKNSAVAHHLHDDTVICDDTCMWIDFGSVYQHYNTDMTRVFYFGKPDPEYERLCEIANQAREAGIMAAQVGAPLGAVDDAAREVIASYGFGQYFTHRTGHGIGILNHEGPSAIHGEMTPIAPGMVFSVEPGIYIPGKYGVRVEDEILIDESGRAIRLHDFPTDLMIFAKEEERENEGPEN